MERKGLSGVWTVNLIWPARALDFIKTGHVGETAATCTMKPFEIPLSFFKTYKYILCECRIGHWIIISTFWPECDLTFYTINIGRMFFFLNHWQIFSPWETSVDAPVVHGPLSGSQCKCTYKHHIISCVLACSANFLKWKNKTKSEFRAGKCLNVKACHNSLYVTIINAAVLPTRAHYWYVLLYTFLEIKK